MFLSRLQDNEKVTVNNF